MRSNIFFSALLYFTLVTVNFSFSATYQTIDHGDWDDPAIWSTNGGVSSCGCTAPLISNGDIIDVLHVVNLTDHFYIGSSGTFTVHSQGKLIGPTFKIGVRTNAIVNINGASVILELLSGKTITSVGGTVNVTNTTLEIKGKINIYAGTVNINGALLFMHVGNFNLYPNGSFITSNGAKLEIYSGNIQNEGLLHICASCCIESQGNWTNEITGTVTGGGSAITNVGNMRNYNSLSSFSSSITWCSAGTDSGMPSTEDCSTSGLVCGGVQLPIELSLFEGINRRDYNEIVWTTETESNTDYFILEKSLDALNWEEIYSEDGTGSSSTSSHYIFEDYNPEQLTYYRLIQVDHNNTEKMSNILSISSSITIGELLIYPNPASNSSSISVSGIEEEGSIIIYNNFGQQVISKVIQDNKGHNTSISTRSLSAGIYILEYNNNQDTSSRTQFIIL